MLLLATCLYKPVVFNLFWAGPLHHSTPKPSKPHKGYYIAAMRTTDVNQRVWLW